MKDLISITDLTRKDILDLFNLTTELKKNRAKFSKALAGKSIVLIFQKPSNRTRVSFEIGMYQLGGASLYLAPHEINLGIRESIKDVAKTLSRYVDGIVARTYEHKTIIELAKNSDKPVINGLSDFCHPCQALADVYTIKEKKNNFKDLTLCYVGDGNNVCNSLLYTCAKVGLNLNVATPIEYVPDAGVIKEAKAIARSENCAINLFNSPDEAVKHVDIIYTDVWTSMGQEKESQKRRKILKRFQVNKRLVKLAKEKVLIMHCLPAHRQEEITDEVIDSRNSIVFDQAENRMHVQKALLIKLLGGKK